MSDDLGLRQVDGKEELALRDRDLMEWVEGLSEHKFSEEGEWLDECRTGVIFCKVLKGISSELSVKFDPKTKDGPAGLWKSRDNLSAYIDKLKELEVVIFESDELVDNSKPENVKSSLHDLARVAFERYGIPLPGATKAGAEIDAEAEVAEEDVDKIAQEVMLTLSQQQLPMVDLDADEDDDASAPNKSMLISMSGGLNLNSPAKDLHLSMAGGLNFDAIDDDPIDQAVEKALLARSRDPAYNSEDGIQVVRLKRGQYLLLPLKKVFFCRILSGRLMVRVGGGWSAFEVWLSRNKGFNTTPALTNGGGMKRPGSIRRGEMERKGSGRLGRKSSSKAMKADDGPETLERAGSFQNKGPLERKASGAALRRAQRHNDPIVGIPRTDSVGSEGMKQHLGSSPGPSPTAKKPGLPSAARGAVKPKKPTESASPEKKPVRKSTEEQPAAVKKPAAKAAKKPAAASPTNATQPKSSVVGSAKKPAATTTPAKKATGTVKKTAAKPATTTTTTTTTPKK